MYTMTQRVGHDLAAEQQQTMVLRVLFVSSLRLTLIVMIHSVNFSLFFFSFNFVLNLFHCTARHVGYIIVP